MIHYLELGAREAFFRDLSSKIYVSLSGIVRFQDTFPYQHEERLLEQVREVKGPSKFDLNYIVEQPNPTELKDIKIAYLKEIDAQEMDYDISLLRLLTQKRDTPFGLSCDQVEQRVRSYRDQLVRILGELVPEPGKPPGYSNSLTIHHLGLLAPHDALSLTDDGTLTLG